MSVKRRKKSKRIIALLLLILSICTMVICGNKLWEIERVYKIGDDYYSGLVEHAHAAEASDARHIHAGLAALRKTNQDAVAWLSGPGTVIDYPVMKATDYDYYLHHLPDGTLNANGTLFIDYNNSPDFSDRLTVIYGHHMRSGRMFGSLNGYKKQSYFDEHPYMYLYTENGDKYRVDLIYGCVIGAGEWRERAFMYGENLDSLLAYAESNTTFKSKAEYTESDRMVAMSTCSYEFDGARYVVIGVLRPDSQS